MRRIVSPTEFSENIGNNIFLYISCQGKFTGFLLTELEITKSLFSGLSNFSCKAIGPANVEVKLKKIISDSGGTLEKFIARTNIVVKFFPESGRLQTEKIVEQKKIRLAIVDDSKTIRQILRKIFSADHSIEVVADFENPTIALEEIKKIKPDVITLDIHMPQMDGVEFLKKLIPTHPIPTVMISSISMEEGPLVLSALESGAVDYIQKPSFEQIPYIASLMIEKIKMAAAAKMKKSKAARPAIRLDSVSVDPSKVFAIGSSTGGTEALRELLTALPAQVPPILIVQHIPAVFSKAFADRMNSLCKFPVKEAVDGEIVKPNHCYVAPGGLQMSILRRKDGMVCIKVEDSEPVNRHKPSVDVLFRTVASVYGRHAIGAILTGMGADGAKGLLEMRNARAKTFGQNEETCVVYGMPQAAYKIGAVEQELPLDEIAPAMMQLAVMKKAS